MIYILAACYFVVYLFFQARGIPAGDSGDLVTAAATLGIAHPPGYPLYTMLGWLANQLPFFTPAWRVGLLSSIPHAITLIFVGKIVYTLTRSKIAGVFSTAVLFVNYIFFLYSITPEVFGLLDLFLVSCIWVLLAFGRTRNNRFVYLFSLCFGAALTHHHFILFGLPAFLYYIYSTRKQNTFIWYKVLVSFCIGFIPYTYILYPPYGSSLIVWNPAINVTNVIKLITRSDYGTFQSAIVYGQLPIQRILNIQTYAQYISMDFLWIGWALMTLGLWHLWKKQHKIGVLFLQLLILFGPLFYFYASFPLAYRFSLGTMERFLLPTYTLFAIMIGVGYSALNQWISHTARNSHLAHVIVFSISGILFLYPLKIAVATLQKTVGYNIDKTAQYVGEDILLSLPQSSIFLADRDTVLFTSEYVRYALQVRPDIILLQGFKLNFLDQHQIFHDRYPELIIPSAHSSDYVFEFLVRNSPKFRIFSYKKYKTDDVYVWEPHGLVYEFVAKAKSMPIEDIITKQTILWNSFHDPSRGILSRFNHLILSDVRDIYTTSRTEYGKILLLANKFPEAISEFSHAISYGGDATISQAYMYKGISEAIEGQCNTAISDFQMSKKSSISIIPELSYYLGITYRDCVKDATESARYLHEFEKSKQSKEVFLQSL